MLYRVKFSKNGPIKYIGHLDVMRYFQKAIRRANLPVAYSEGYSPHQILSFAFPLSVGYTSEGEYFDVEMTEEVNESEFIERLSKVMTDGFKILAVRIMPEKSQNCMSSVFAAGYKVTIKEGVSLREDYVEVINDYLGQKTIPVNKPKKKGGGFVEIDLKDFLYSYDVKERTIAFVVNASSSDNIKPSFVAECIFNELGIEFKPVLVQIHRTELYANKFSGEEVNMVSLMEI